VDVAWLAANCTRLTEREHQCAYHIVGENQRVVAGARALREGDFAQFGQFLLQSHESSRDHFGNSCAELDLLVDLARKHPGCLGARLTGGGFGGATLNLVRRDQVESFSHAMSTVFEKRTGRGLKPMLCRIVDGAGSGMTNDQ
jgi:galactokinase